MKREFKCGLAISGSELIGYWGVGELHGSSANDLSSTRERTLLVSILNLPIQPLTDAPQGISAAGLEAPDCWVRLAGDDLILGREPFGRVPLYWTQVGESLWFASHLRLLLQIGEDKSIDLAGFYGYSCFSYVPTPLTPLVGIHAVPAGAELCLSLTDGKIVSRSRSVRAAESISVLPWQNRLATPQLADESVAVSQLQELLPDAIDRQIADLPDAPVGVFLSGGLDSAIVAALLVKNGVKVRAYTLDFGELDSSERPYAELVAQHLKIPITPIPVAPRDVRNAIDPTARALDAPFGDGVTVPLYLLCQAAKDEVAVVFNGEGGDQLFAGWTNKPTIAASVYGGDPDFDRYYLQTFHRLYGYERQSFQPHILPEIYPISPLDWIEDAIDPQFAPELFQRLRRASLMLKGAQNIQPRATNIALWHGLQVRSIFCDLPLAEWTFGVAGTLYLQGACEKYILKRAVEHLLPAEIVWRTKRGMGVPVTAWLLGELWGDLGGWLNPQVLQTGGYWQTDIAARLVSNQFGGNIQGRRIGELLWLVIMWERWRANVLGIEPTGKSWRHPFWLPPALWRIFQRVSIGIAPDGIF